MPRKSDITPIGNKTLKRSSKLLDCQKEMIVYWYKVQGISINAIARMFHVHKRTIQFILFPERHKKNLELRADRGGSKVYYVKAKHTSAMKKHRDYKKELFNAN